MQQRSSAPWWQVLAAKPAAAAPFSPKLVIVAALELGSALPGDNSLIYLPVPRFVFANRRGRHVKSNEWLNSTVNVWACPPRICPIWVPNSEGSAFGH